MPSPVLPFYIERRLDGLYCTVQVVPTSIATSIRADQNSDISIRYSTPNNTHRDIRSSSNQYGSVQFYVLIAVSSISSLIG